MINKVLDALQTYMMSIFRVPTDMVDRTDALRRNLLWQGKHDTNKIYLVKSVIISKNYGSMGIKNLLTQNHSVVMKW